MVLEYDTLILTINKRFENGNTFDANICTVIHIVDGYVILAETIGLISFHGSELSYSILSRKKWKKNYIPFDGGSFRCGDRVHYFTWLLLTSGTILSMRLRWFVAIVNMIYLQWLFVKALNWYLPLSFNANEMNKKVWWCH